MKLRYEHTLHQFLVSRNSGQWWIPSYWTSRTGFATIGFLQTFGVGDKLRFLGGPGVLFGHFPAKSKPEAQFFVTWRSVIWFEFRTFSCCIYLRYNNHAFTLHMFKQWVIIFKYHLFLVWISTWYSAINISERSTPPCFDYTVLSHQDKRRQHDLLTWHLIAF